MYSISDDNVPRVAGVDDVDVVGGVHSQGAGLHEPLLLHTLNIQYM